MLGANTGSRSSDIDSILISYTNAVLNCILNYVLIRAIGLPGAAVATLVSALLACVAYFVLGQPHYRITYPWGRLGTAAGVAVALALMPFITCLDFSPVAGIGVPPLCFGCL